MQYKSAQVNSLVWNEKVYCPRIHIFSYVCIIFKNKKSKTRINDIKIVCNCSYLEFRLRQCSIYFRKIFYYVVAETEEYTVSIWKVDLVR